MATIIRNGVRYGGGGSGNTKSIEMTRAEWEALGDEKYSNDITYFITDGVTSGGSGTDISAGIDSAVRYNKDTYYLEVKIGDTWETTLLKANIGELVELIPTLTGYTSAKGTCVYSSVLSDDYLPWKTFDGDNSTIGACSTSTSNYIGFQWSNEVYVDNVSVAFLYTHGDAKSLNLKLQYYNGTTWVDVENSAFDETFTGGSSWQERSYEFSVKKTVNGIRFY
jgi:hypothetical protein